MAKEVALVHAQTYLGDGVYARYNGQELVLCTEDHEIWLSPAMLKRCQSMVDDYEPSAARERTGRIPRELKR